MVIKHDINSIVGICAHISAVCYFRKHLCSDYVYYLYFNYVYILRVITWSAFSISDHFSKQDEKHASVFVIFVRSLHETWMDSASFCTFDISPFGSCKSTSLFKRRIRKSTPYHSKHSFPYKPRMEHSS